MTLGFRPLPGAALAGALDDLARRNTELIASEVLRRTPYGAKAAIWQEQVEFGEHVEGFTLAAGRLLQAIEAHAAERVPAELAAVRYQCLACHYHYAAWENRPGVEGRRAVQKPLAFRLGSGL